jgi:hypothetical protein
MNESLGFARKDGLGRISRSAVRRAPRHDLDDRTAAVVRFNHAPEVIVPMTPVPSTTAPAQAQIRTQVDTGLPPPAGTTAIAGGTWIGNEINHTEERIRRGDCPPVFRLLSTVE